MVFQLIVNNCCGVVKAWVCRLLLGSRLSMCSFLTCRSSGPLPVWQCGPGRLAGPVALLPTWHSRLQLPCQGRQAACPGDAVHRARLAAGSTLHQTITNAPGGTAWLGHWQWRGSLQLIGGPAEPHSHCKGWVCTAGQALLAHVHAYGLQRQGAGVLGRFVGRCLVGWSTLQRGVEFHTLR
jgi:hypothetical protein